MSRIRPGELFSFCNLRIPRTLFWAIILAVFVHQEQQSQRVFPPPVEWRTCRMGREIHTSVCMYICRHIRKAQK